jgi:hypothetical protein
VQTYSDTGVFNAHERAFQVWGRHMSNLWKRQYWPAGRTVARAAAIFEHVAAKPVPAASATRVIAVTVTY